MGAPSVRRIEVQRTTLTLDRSCALGAFALWVMGEESLRRGFWRQRKLVEGVPFRAVVRRSRNGTPSSLPSPAPGGTLDATLLLELGQRVTETLVVDRQPIAEVGPRDGLVVPRELDEDTLGQ